MAAPRGRYAPSPTGEMHLGNASSALLAWLSVRARDGTFVMRMEDLDRNRVQPGLAERILEDLAWLGLDWDEGPDCGGMHAPYEQWPRRELYRAAFKKLLVAGRLYRCFCSRKDVAAAASAPQTPGEEVRYPGTCLELSADEAADRLAAGARHAWRFRVASRVGPGFHDLVCGRRGDDLAPPGDFVVWRSDEVPAYQLAVVVDDLEMDITEVGPDGVRLSKRHRGVTLREMRESGFTPERIVGHLACLVGLRPTPEPVPARAVVDGFSLGRIRPAPDGIVVDPSGWS